MKLISPTGKGIRNDPEGLGNYGAPRGSRLHDGTDFVCDPGQEVVAPVDGIILRVAYPYAGDKMYRGAIIVAPKMVIKMFYFIVFKDLIGKLVLQGDTIGIAQDISKKYNKPLMKPHIHLAIDSIDPEILLDV